MTILLSIEVLVEICYKVIHFSYSASTLKRSSTLPKTETLEPNKTEKSPTIFTPITLETEKLSTWNEIIEDTGKQKVYHLQKVTIYKYLKLRLRKNK